MVKKDKYLVGLGHRQHKNVRTASRNGKRAGEIPGAGRGGIERPCARGLIVNLDSTVSSIRRAVEEAEGVANVPVESAVIGVAGSHVRGVNSRGGVPLGPRPRDIERDDLKRTIDAARNVSVAGRSRSAARPFRTNLSSTRRMAFAIQSAWWGSVWKRMCTL